MTILNKPDNSDNYFRANHSGITGPNLTWAVGEGVLVQFDVPPGLSHAMVNGEFRAQGGHCDSTQRPDAGSVMVVVPSGTSNAAPSASVLPG